MLPSTVNRNAHALLNNNKIATRIKELRNESYKKDSYELQTILDGFGQVAFANITDIIDYDAESDKITLAGGANKLSDLPREVTDCIASIKQTKAGFEIKLYSKDQALVQIAKMMGYYAPEKVMQVTTTLADLFKK
jgi:hypothetical protein